jgi:formate dehydrogenase subunit delta
MSPDEKLIYMANQIAGFFAAQGDERAVAGIANHLERFWDPQMRRRLLVLAPEHTAQLSPLVLSALPQMKVPPGLPR